MTAYTYFPRLTDNDEGEITVTLDGVELRGWSYANRDEQCLKMKMAREFCEGWHEGFSSGLDRAKAAMLETFGKKFFADPAPSIAGTNLNDV